MLHPRHSNEIQTHWRPLLASGVGLVFSVGTVLLYTFGVFMAPLERAFGWSRGALSAGILAMQLSLALASPLYGVLVDRFGARRMVLTSIPLLALCVAALGMMSGALWQYYLLLALAPLIAGAASPIGYARVIIDHFDHRRGLALGLALAGVGLGAALLPPLAQALITAWGWRTAYAALGAMTAAVTLPICLLYLHDARSARTHTPPEQPIRALILSGLFARLSIVFILMGAVTVAAVTHLVPLLKTAGYSDSASAAMAAVIGLAVIMGRALVGYAMDHIAGARVVALMLGLFALAALILASGPAPLMAGAAAFLIGIAVGAEVDAIAYMISRYFPRAAFSRLYGVVFGVFMAACGVGPLLLGIAYESAGNYNVGLWTMAGLAILAAITALGLPDTRKTDGYFQT